MINRATRRERAQIDAHGLFLGTGGQGAGEDQAGQQGADE